MVINKINKIIIKWIKLLFIIVIPVIEIITLIFDKYAGLVFFVFFVFPVELLLLYIWLDTYYPNHRLSKSYIKIIDTASSMDRGKLVDFLLSDRMESDMVSSSDVLCSLEHHSVCIANDVVSSECLEEQKTSETTGKIGASLSESF